MASLQLDPFPVSDASGWNRDGTVRRFKAQIIINPFAINGTLRRTCARHVRSAFQKTFASMLIHAQTVLKVPRKSVENLLIFFYC